MQLKVTKAVSWKEKIIGLIGKKEITPLYFETRWGIHTFGVRNPIDIIILDRENRVRVIKNNLKPNRIFLWNPKYNRVIEMPSPKIKKMKIKLNQKIIIDYC